MSVCCGCCVLSGRGLCDGLITRPEESYRLWCVVVCDQEKQTSWMRRPRPTRGLSRQEKKNWPERVNLYCRQIMMLPRKTKITCHVVGSRPRWFVPPSRTPLVGTECSITK